jgi:hypothetical protein
VVGKFGNRVPLEEGEAQVSNDEANQAADGLRGLLLVAAQRERCGTNLAGEEVINADDAAEFESETVEQTQNPLESGEALWEGLQHVREGADVGARPEEASVAEKGDKVGGVGGKPHDDGGGGGAKAEALCCSGGG